MDVDLEMVRSAVDIYTDRNTACHAEVGAPDIVNDLPALDKTIARDIQRLPQILPDGLKPKREILSL
ncbi:hypothetical protein AWENTII_005971 [Aspergillus wentii]